MVLRPLITICGSTGVGKSKFAVELAHKLFRGSTSHRWKGARIINADCMQVYAGMDVVTNKVPKAEMEGIEHLLMAFKQPGEPYFVDQWVQDTMAAVSVSNTYFINANIPVRRSKKHIPGIKYLLSLGGRYTGFNALCSRIAQHHLRPFRCPRHRFLTIHLRVL